MRQAEEGEATSRKVGAKLSEMGTNVARVSEAVAEISGVAADQAKSEAQVTQAVTKIGRVTKRNAASAEESSATATELTDRAKELAEIVGSFRLSQAEEAHGRAAPPKELGPGGKWARWLHQALRQCSSNESS